MTISVVIPACNEAQYIGHCLNGFRHQTISPNEIIVVNNNSRDATVAIAEKYGAHILHEKKQGMIYARNAGFNAVHSDIIARCDADTIAAPDWIERIGPNMALTKTMWNKVKNEVCLDDRIVHEDIDLAIHIKKYGVVAFDPELCVHTSARRIRKNVFSFFVEYPIRFVKTLHQH